jgi:hypothetical protein
MFRACRDTSSSWPGGFVVHTDHLRACLPLDVYAGDERGPQHVTLSLFNGNC